MMEIIETIEMTEYAQRRRLLMEIVGDRGIVILPSARSYFRNGETQYPYRQNSDFYYLSGFEESDAVIVLAPGRDKGEFILFNQKRNRAEELWTGYRAGQPGALEIFKADDAYPIEKFSEILPELLMGREHIHYTLGLDSVFDQLLLKALNEIRGKIRSGIQSPLVFMDITQTIHEMRLIKSPAEIAIMRKAAQITAKAHNRAMRACKPGIYEYQLEAELNYEFNLHGARFQAYGSIIGSGANSCILHYTQNNQMIQKEQIVLIDAGCEYQNYASDVTRSFPANGCFSGEQKAIYEIVLAAQLAGIETIRTGTLWSAAQEVIVKIITQGLIDLKILKGELAGLIEKQAYFNFYMHKSGHWLGLDVHDVGRYKIDNQWRALEPGMILTMEPGIYIAADESNVDPRWHNIGIRIEDDILVTHNDPEVLSQEVPKKVDDIEALMRH